MVIIIDIKLRIFTEALHGPSVLADKSILVLSSIIDPTFIGFEKTSCSWSVQFFSVSHRSTSVANPRVTPVSIAKTTESCEAD